MDRFRVTFLAISAVLLFLGLNDLELWWRNRTPTPIDITILAAQGPPTEWLKVTDGYLDLDRAISTSGTVELEALLVPLISAPDREEIRVLLETRHPRTLDLVRGYHFLPETVEEQRAFREEHAAEFVAQRDITGMLVSGMIAEGNRENLLELAQQTGLNITEDVIFISEGKVPQFWRGLFFSLVGMLTILKVFWPKTPRARKK